MQAEPDHEDVGETERPLRAGLPDREALREVVQADPARDEEREPTRGSEAREVRALELRRRGGARPEEALAPPRLHPRVVVDEGQEPQREPAERER